MLGQKVILVDMKGISHNSSTEEMSNKNISLLYNYRIISVSITTKLDFLEKGMRDLAVIS
jgi:hypothetical protein